MQGTQNALSGAQLLKSKTSEKIKAPMRRRTQLGFGVGGEIEVTRVDVCRGSKHGGGGEALVWKEAPVSKPSLYSILRAVAGFASGRS